MLVWSDQLVQSVVEAITDRLTGRPDEVVDRTLHSEVELAGEAGVDDFAVAWLAVLATDKELRHRRKRFDRRRAADPGGRPVGECLQSL